MSIVKSYNYVLFLILFEFSYIHMHAYIKRQARQPYNLNINTENRIYPTLSCCSYILYGYGLQQFTVVLE